MVVGFKMSNPWLLGVKNGGCEKDSRLKGEDRPVPIGSRDGTEDSSALSRSTVAPVEVEKISERQDGARWIEREQTYDRSVDMMNTENEMVESGMYNRHIVVPGFVQNGAMNAGIPSSEWVMLAGELGQVFLEIPDNQAGNFLGGCAQLNGKHAKAELGDLENSALSGNNLLDICNPRPLKQSLMGIDSESVSNTDFALFDCSSDKSTTKNCDQPQFKLDDPNLFHIIEIVPQKPPLGIDTCEKNILEQLSVPESSCLQTLPSATIKNEVYESSTFNLQTVEFEKLLSVSNTSASNRCFPEECFSVASFENVMDVNRSPGTDSHLCQITDVPSVNDNNDVLPLCQTRSYKLNEEAVLSSSQCVLSSDTGLSVMDLVLETSVFIKDGYESEIKKQILTYGDALPLTFNTECVNIATSSPDVGFNELNHSGIQKPLPVNVLSVVSIGNRSGNVATC